jgi:hypothetical protein
MKHFSRAKKALYTTFDNRTSLPPYICDKLKFIPIHDISEDVINSWIIEIAADIIAFDICRNMKAEANTPMEKELNEVLPFFLKSLLFLKS